jgi:hypothetical protein
MCDDEPSSAQPNTFLLHFCSYAFVHSSNASITGEEAIKSRYAPGLAKAGIVDRPFISVSTHVHDWCRKLPEMSDVE